MIQEIFREATRGNTDAITEMVIENALSAIQRGYIKKPQFFGDMSYNPSQKAFKEASFASAAYAGATSVLRSDLVSSRGEGDVFRLTFAEMQELQRRAESISSYGDIPYDIAEDFLLILCYINVLDDMITIADALQIPELADVTILRQPMIILGIPGLEKVAYLASAVEGLVNMFRKYLNSPSYTSGGSGDSMADILSNIGAITSGVGIGFGVMEMLQSGTPEKAIGNFMSELLTGKRIPMSVIAKNPNMQAPSWAGKTFFGESPNALSVIDITEIFAKKIGAFPKPTNGSGATSFSLQNMGSLSANMTIGGLISKMNFGNMSFSLGTTKGNFIVGIADQIQSLTGAKISDVIDIRRADTAIPLMSALSTISAGFGSSPFPLDTFQQGWIMANAVTSYTRNNIPEVEAMRRFL